MGLNPVKEISIGGSYSYIYRENKEDRALKFTDVPAHKGILYGKFALPRHSGAYLHVDWEVNSKRYRTSDGETLPGYGIVNAKVFARVWNGFSLEAGVKNVGDKNYYLSFNYPREGRTYFTSLVYDF